MEDERITRDNSWLGFTRKLSTRVPWLPSVQEIMQIMIKKHLEKSCIFFGHRKTNEHIIGLRHLILFRKEVTHIDFWNSYIFALFANELLFFVDFSSSYCWEKITFLYHSYCASINAYQILRISTLIELY